MCDHKIPWLTVLDPEVYSRVPYYIVMYQSWERISQMVLTHWGRDKMAAISQTTLSNVFSWMKMLEFRLKVHWSLFIRIQLTIFQYWFRWWLGADQATSHYLNQWWLDYRRIYASLGLNELKDNWFIWHHFSRLWRHFLFNWASPKICFSFLKVLRNQLECVAQYPESTDIPNVVAICHISRWISPTKSDKYAIFPPLDKIFENIMAWNFVILEASHKITISTTLWWLHSK